MKNLAIWICIIAIALYCFSYTFNVQASFEDAFNLTIGTFVNTVSKIYENIRDNLGWLWGDGKIFNAWDYIMRVTGLNKMWEFMFPSDIT